MALILDEFRRTRHVLEEIFGHTFEVRRPRMEKTLRLRSEGLRRLHVQQIELLRNWRGAMNRCDTQAADAMLPQLLLSINAIASGLRTTG
jgi:phosphoenolpyruvate carboxylase